MRWSLEWCVSFGQVVDIRGQCDAGLASRRPVANPGHGGRRSRLATATRTTPTTRDQVTCDAAEVGVNDEIQDEVDGEVGQQKEVRDVYSNLERAVGTEPGCTAARCQGDELEQVRWSDKQRE